MGSLKPCIMSDPEAKWKLISVDRAELTVFRSNSRGQVTVEPPSHPPQDGSLDGVWLVDSMSSDK